MIAYVEGKLEQLNPAYAVIDVGGVGYHINISLNTYEKISNLQRCRLLTHQVIKEDAHQLFGFFEENERELFRHLISISGVGPNTARMMLSSMSAKELKQAIIRGDVSLMKSIKGIGPKSAQRIIVELQDVLQRSVSEEYDGLVQQNRVVEEALAALVTLGVQRNVAEKVVAKVQKEHGQDISIEELIKQALKSI